MAIPKWCSLSLREMILIILLCGGIFAWFREHRALKRAEALYGPLEGAYQYAKSFGGDYAVTREVDGIEIEWSVHTVSNRDGETKASGTNP